MSYPSGADDFDELVKFVKRNIDDFYANYITTDGVDMLVNLTNLAIFMQITSPEMGLTCWRMWRFW